MHEISFEKICARVRAKNPHVLKYHPGLPCYRYDGEWHWIHQETVSSSSSGLLDHLSTPPPPEGGRLPRRL